MIIGERVRFRGVERSDIPTFVRWLNDPEVRKGILLHSPISQAWEENWFEKMIQRPPDQQVMAIEALVPGEQGGEAHWVHIGSIAFDDIDWRNRQAEFGILIGEKQDWNRGYGTDSVCLLVKHGFNTLGLHRIYLHVFETNPRAIRAYEKAGFTHEGKKRQAEIKDGRFIDVLVMSILEGETRSTP
jgi:RimJ/RimL family protein N-acetyltransferase